ncbi:hypothetical protein FBZ82_108269 [Azospirillum brasilense]|uniref:Uncharacterized protein n=1 Tax=Azospirillum brasilense TaxID=192 RepID=A0A560B271_AZOBR|nr:hypothetical protein [Azospirillum brasilense]TWA66599.1 hypothetical protein FBZ82_108269 [Azospirillum brasilense]
MTEMMPLSNAEDTPPPPAAPAKRATRPRAPKASLGAPSEETTQLLRVYGDQVATLGEQIAKAEAAADSERAERLRVIAEHASERERWREAIGEVERARSGEVGSLQGDREAERERVNQLVETLIAETSAREEGMARALRDAEDRLSAVNAEIAALRLSHAVALDRLQADREAERKRIGDLVERLIADTEVRERSFRQRIEAAERRSEEAQAALEEERRTGAELEKRVERLTGTLDGLRRDREAEVAAYEAMRDQCRVLVTELARRQSPWWRRLFRR